MNNNLTYKNLIEEAILIVSNPAEADKYLSQVKAEKLSELLLEMFGSAYTTVIDKFLVTVYMLGIKHGRSNPN